MNAYDTIVIMSSNNVNNTPNTDELSLHDYTVKAKSLLSTFNKNRKQAIQESVYESRQYRIPSRVRWNHTDYTDITVDELAELLNAEKFTRNECNVIRKIILQYASLYCSYQSNGKHYGIVRNYALPDKTMLKDALHYYKKTNNATGFKILLKLINDDNIHSFLLTEDEYVHIIRNNIDNGKLQAFLDNSNLKTIKNRLNKITLGNGKQTPLQNIIHNWLYPILADRTIDFLPGNTPITKDNNNVNRDYDNIILFITHIMHAGISKMNLTRKEIMNTYIRIHDELGHEGDEYCIQLAEHMGKDDSIFTEFNYDYIMNNHEYPVEFVVQRGSVGTVVKQKIYYDMAHAWNEKTNKPGNTDDGLSTYLGDCMSDFFQSVYKWDSDSNYKKINYDSSSNTFNSLTGLMNEKSMVNFSNALINIGNIPDWLVLELNRLKPVRINMTGRRWNHKMLPCCNVQDYQFVKSMRIEKHSIISGFRNMLKTPDNAARFLIYHEIAMFIACNENKMVADEKSDSNSMFNDVVLRGKLRADYYTMHFPTVIHDVIISILNDYRSSDKIRSLVDNHSSIRQVFHDRLNGIQSNHADINAMIGNYNTYYDGGIVPDNSYNIWSIA